MKVRRTVVAIALAFVVGMLLMAWIGHLHRPAVPAPLFVPTQAELALEKIVPRIDLDAATFAEVVETVRKLAGVPVEVDGPELTTAGLDPRQKLSLHFRDTPLKTILDQVMKYLVSNGSCGIRDGHIVLTTEDTVARDVICRCYDVRDLLEVQPSRTTATTGPFVSGLSVGPSNPPQPMSQAQLQTQAQEDLYYVLENVVSFDSWRDNGGRMMLRILGGRMLIYQTWENQRKTEKLLDMLRRPELPPEANSRTSNVTSAGRAMRERERHREAALDRLIPLVRIENLSLHDAIDTLRRLSGADIELDPLLTAQDVPPFTTVSVVLHNASTLEVLDAMFREPVQQVRLGYTIDNGIVFITKEDKSTKPPLIPRVYEVRDLIPASTNEAVGPQIVARTEPASTPDEIADDLVRVIESLIDPDSWQDNGGPALIKPFNRCFVVSQTVTNHNRLVRLLEEIRSRGVAPIKAASEKACDGGN